ncbi:homeodomain-interacting protein kinase 4-like [Boleophthalmus pectinirostris]|uniref:homeodomain-interacting protein kinase 4-like n=1 Tax=Boleophthalmus pectinirostris TaxID=150288 RepID=UPI002430C190|nr:homeodomain-interacting protein kinase 4-like [Boleophthalmus pectinirostris]
MFHCRSAASPSTSSLTNTHNRDQTADPMDKYEIIQTIGEGVYGEVMKCLNKQTGQIVALKKVKASDEVDDVVNQEISMLNAIRHFDPDKCNFIRFHNHVQSVVVEHYLEFEMLDQSVWDLMVKRHHAGFSLSEVRTMARQLLVALDSLRSIGVIHTDIKPDNIMLVDHTKKPFKLKLIDFGLAIHKETVKLGCNMQARLYRAPEVICANR